MNTPEKQTTEGVATGSAPSAVTSIKKRPLVPKGGNDRVYTPDALASEIVAHFRPSGSVLEPCKGNGAFVRAIPNCQWCELDEGIDFLSHNARHDWIVTNPPWSQFRAFLCHSMALADNIVFLSLVNAFFMRARVQDMRMAGFGIVEIRMIPTPPKPWPQTGFQLGATYIRRGYTGPTAFSMPNP